MIQKKEHWADTEIRKAAVEIDEGRYVPEPKTEEDDAVDHLGISLGMGNTGAAVGDKPLLEDFHQTRDFNELGMHPRVEEAMHKMRLEIDEHPDSQEAVEMSWMLHEMTEKAVAEQKWKGQQRWEGKENEEMRQGQVISPQSFYGRLCEVVGTSRVYIERHAHLTHPEARSGRVGLYIPNPEWKGVSRIIEFPQVKAAQLKKGAELELVKAKRLRLAKHHAEADKAYHLAGDMIQAATEIHMEQAEFTQNEAEKEFLRVGILQWPLGTEWMMMNFNEYGVPTTAMFTGWRTAILTLVRNFVITEDEAEEAFPVGQGPAAEWFKQQLYFRRNRPGKRVQ